MPYGKTKSKASKNVQNAAKYMPVNAKNNGY